MNELPNWRDMVMMLAGIHAYHFKGSIGDLFQLQSIHGLHSGVDEAWLTNLWRKHFNEDGSRRP